MSQLPPPKDPGAVEAPSGQLELACQQAVLQKLLQAVVDRGHAEQGLNAEQVDWAKSEDTELSLIHI